MGDQVAISFRLTKAQKRAFYLVSKSMGLTVQEAGAAALAEWAQRHRGIAEQGLRRAIERGEPSVRTSAPRAMAVSITVDGPRRHSSGRTPIARASEMLRTR
jgi:hypothetical protein